MTLADLLGEITVGKFLIFVGIGIALVYKALYYSTGADEIYNKEKNEYNAKFGKGGSNQSTKEVTPQAEKDTTPSTPSNLGQWDEQSVDTVNQDSRVTYDDPIDAEGNLGEGDSQSQQQIESQPVPKGGPSDEDGFREV